MNKKKKHKTALRVLNGVDCPASVNEKAVKKLKDVRKKTGVPEEYIKGILSGNRTVLSKAITLIESSLEQHKSIARDVIESCLPHSGNSLRIGITGVPGVGKSMFIESFGKYLTGMGHKVAVLAIDPSSTRSKGSILGDKTRMEALAADENAFIRPSPSGGSLGGVAGKTREAVILCEAGGYDIIIIETVGVGQSETAVHSMTDIFLLMMLAGAGDELQGIKRGIMEMADLIAINKADGNNVGKADQARADYENAIRLFPLSASGWTPKVLKCSALTKSGIPEIYNSILEYKELTQKNNYFFHKRTMQSKYWMYETINENLTQNFYNNYEISTLLKGFEKKVMDNKMSPFTAASMLLEKFGVNK
jgi:LAO/AO transport system kinase